jgi:phage shock protein E
MRDPITWLLLAVGAFLAIRLIMNARRRIAPAEARAKVQAGAVLLDVRSRAEFSGGALPGALNVPVQELGARLGELPKEKPLVVYCASGMRSASAVSMLRARGFDAHDLGPGSRWPAA